MSCQKSGEKYLEERAKKGDQNAQRELSLTYPGLWHFWSFYNLTMGFEQFLPLKEVVSNTEKVINSVGERKNLHNQLKTIGLQNPKPEEIKAANHILNTLKLPSLTPEQIKKVVFARSLGFLEPSIKVLKTINNFINIYKRNPSNKKEILKAMEKDK